MQSGGSEKGMRIALERIAREAEERTGFLDLGWLGLKTLPEALFGLRHLRSLNLGAAYVDEAGRWLYAASNIAANDIGLELLRLAGLPELQALWLWATPWYDLSPLSGLAALQTLHCGWNQVADLSPLSGLAALQTLHCGNTQVADLSPLSGLGALQTLHCSSTRVADLSPLSSLKNLQDLNFSYCRLMRIPDGFWDKPSLQKLLLENAKLPGVSPEILSRNLSDNCLQRLRSDLRDKEAGSETLPDVKLMILGNGRVGKTQICRRLKNEDYDESIPSTHGIQINSASLKQSDGEELARLQAWDFGGQEIYHGTHALFLKTRAVFLVVWASAAPSSSDLLPLEEGRKGQEHGEMKFRNHPLAYWLAYVRHLAGPGSPVIVVQTRCDRPEDEARRLPVEDADMDAFPFFKFVHFSSLKNRGRACLDEALRQAVEWLRQQQGKTLIGAGRLRVQRRLEDLREADAKLPAGQRQYRTLTRDYFRQLCAETGGVSSWEHLLDYLHQAGVVFYRQGLFGGRIVLDQGWALEAIYTVFHREKCYRYLKQEHGRFKRTLLDMLVWQAHSEDEQTLFLGMMQSCGVCFVHKPGDQKKGIEAEYIAPELLPDKAEVADSLAEKWDESQACATAVYRYALHQPGLLRSLMAEIGQQAGVNGLYWQNGVCVFERATGSHALIEQESLNDWRGLIRIRTQGGQAAELLTRLRKRLQAQNQRWGLLAEERDNIASGDAIPAAPLIFSQPPKPGLQYYVSYKRGGDSAAMVDRLCREAQARGIHVLRDTTELRFNDRISQFMQAIGQGDRVFVILSDPYLKSSYCMYELFEIWRNSLQRPDEFLRRVRVYRMECAKIFSVLERTRYIEYWQEQYEGIKEFMRRRPDKLSPASYDAFRTMGYFADHVDEILAAVADVIHARTFEELRQYGLDGE